MTDPMEYNRMHPMDRATSYDEHLISQAGGDGDGCHECSYQEPHKHGFACNSDCKTCTEWLAKEREPNTRTEDFTVDELFSAPSIEWSTGVPEPCSECGALVWVLETHVKWHNKLLP